MGGEDVGEALHGFDLADDIAARVVALGELGARAEIDNVHPGGMGASGRVAIGVPPCLNEEKALQVATERWKARL